MVSRRAVITLAVNGPAMDGAIQTVLMAKVYMKTKCLPFILRICESPEKQSNTL